MNAGTFLEEEADCLKWLVEAVQEASELPLCIDSPSPQAIGAVLPFVDKAPLINAVTLEPERLEGILPLVVEYKAKVVGLCQSDQSMADTVEAKLEMAGQLVEAAEAAGIGRDDLYIDTLVYPLSSDAASALASLEAIRQIMKAYAGVHTTCGLTNVSHGLPLRKLVNRTFLVAAVAHGADSAIMDPTDDALYAALKTILAVMGQDDFCLEYISAFREGRLG